MGEDEEEECVTVSRGKSLVQRIRLKVRGASNKVSKLSPQHSSSSLDVIEFS